MRQIIKGKSNNDGTRDQDIILVEFEGYTGGLGLPNGRGTNNVIPIVKFAEWSSKHKVNR